MFTYKVGEWVIYYEKPYTVMSRTTWNGVPMYRLRNVSEYVPESGLISEEIHNSPLYKALR